MSPNEAIKQTAFWTRAWKAGKFNPPLVSQGGTCLEEWFPFMEEDAGFTPEEVYNLVKERLNRDSKPSWRAVAAFSTFMESTFTRFGNWEECFEIPENALTYIRTVYGPVSDRAHWELGGATKFYSGPYMG